MNGLRRSGSLQREDQGLVGDLGQVVDRLTPAVVAPGLGFGVGAVALDERAEGGVVAIAGIADVHGPVVHLDRGSPGLARPPGAVDPIGGHGRHRPGPVGRLFEGVERAPAAADLPGEQRGGHLSAVPGCACAYTCAVVRPTADQRTPRRVGLIASAF
jgi:hypothetical protein